MVKLDRERIIPSISRLCQLQMLDPTGISSSLRSGPTRMNPLHHRIQEGISPIHHDDNLLQGPRGRLRSQRQVQSGMEFGKRMSMMSRIYLLIERVQDLPFLCARLRPIRLRHRGGLHLPLRSLLFLDYLHLEPLPPIPPLPMVLDLPYLAHHTHRPLRRFTVSARLSPVDQTPHPTATKHPPHRYLSTTQSPHLDHPITSPSPALSITQSPRFDYPLTFNISASRTFSIIEGRTHSPTLHQPCIIITRISHTLHIAFIGTIRIFYPPFRPLPVTGTVSGLQYTCHPWLHLLPICHRVVTPFRFHFVVLLSRSLLGTSRSRRFLYTPLRQVLCLYF
jgi:hypothetical protein